MNKKHLIIMYIESHEISQGILDMIWSILIHS